MKKMRNYVRNLKQECCDEIYVVIVISIERDEWVAILKEAISYILKDFDQDT